MLKLACIPAAIVAATVIGCATTQSGDRGANAVGLNKIGPSGSVLPYTVLATLPNGTEIRNGGYGSSMTGVPGKPGHFYAMTDRGPNIDFSGTAGAGKKFSVPDYAPRIGEFSVEGNGSVSFVREILFKDPTGKPITGRPNPEGLGSTGELPYDESGAVLPLDPYGLDSEGLVAMKDGTFYVSDEYGPHIVHYAADGRELERMSPVGVNTSGRKLPAVFARRWANRGMEGLTVTPDGKTLVGIMQSTLYNPTKKRATNMTLVRILSFDLETGKTAQYLYRQEIQKNANSEIAALTDRTFAVIERDGNFSGETPDAMKKLYRIDLSGATDVSGDVNAPDGLLVNGKALEECSWDELSAAGIVPVQKTEILDVVAALPNRYPHDKLEGLWVIDPVTIAVINDDDFAVAPENGNTVRKVLPGTAGQIDANTLYVFKLSNPLF